MELLAPREPARASGGDASLGDLVRAAAASDPEAWQALVNRLGGLVWAIARAHGLDRCDAADVSQTVWLRLVDNLDQLREPDRVASWLATTARHESIRVSAQRGRTTLAGDVAVFDVADHAGRAQDPVASMVGRERDTAVREIIATLPSRWQAMLRLLMADPPASYSEVAAGLGIPVGSIGPTRQRCLRALRAKCALAGIEL
jgi:RNA polymerase sigma factor (sigma-70 family)